MNRESTIHQNERIVLIKESIHKLRIDSKSRFSGESTIRQNEIILLIKESIHESRIDSKSRFLGEP